MGTIYFSLTNFQNIPNENSGHNSQQYYINFPNKLHINLFIHYIQNLSQFTNQNYLYHVFLNSQTVDEDDADSVNVAISSVFSNFFFLKKVDNASNKLKSIQKSRVPLSYQESKLQQSPSRFLILICKFFPEQKINKISSIFCNMLDHHSHITSICRHYIYMRNILQYLVQNFTYIQYNWFLIHTVHNENRRISDQKLVSNLEQVKTLSSK